MPFRIIVAITYFLGFAGVLHAGEEGEPTHRPNVLLIISDDHAWTDYGFMGHPQIRTPSIDRLASESLVFTRGYVPSSLCRPSLATIITGLYPHQHGITGNDPDLPDPKVNPMAGRASPQFAAFYETLMQRIEAVPTLPRILGEVGYVSLQTGKWWEGSFRRGGFTQGMTHGDPKRGGRHGDEGLKIGRQGLTRIYDFVREAKSANHPFFVWYAPLMPHAPHTPPEEILTKYATLNLTPAQARYYAMCEWFDATIGELLDFLEKEGLRENTIICYVADNGWIQDPEKPNQFAPKSKRSPYDGGLRTPIMFSWPGRIKPRRDDVTLVSSIDIAPTLLNLCNVPVPEGLPGLNVMDRTALEKRRAIFGEVYAHNVADVEVPTKSLQYRWIIQDEWKLIVPADPKEKVELYQILKDPHETADLSEKQPEMVKELKDTLDRWWPGAASEGKK
ncbi:MAG: sulfatase family protein [Thermogutta sp.]